MSRRPGRVTTREYVPAITKATDWTPAPCPAQTQRPLPELPAQVGVVCALAHHHRGWHLSTCGWSWNPETGQALAFPTQP